MPLRRTVLSTLQRANEQPLHINSPASATRLQFTWTIIDPDSYLFANDSADVTRIFQRANEPVVVVEQQVPDIWERKGKRIPLFSGWKKTRC